ncbi:MAG: MFS transporter [Phycisphaerales bacterium]
MISAVGVFLEIGYLLIFGWLIKRFGVKGLALIGIAATALRMGLLATVPTLTIAVGTQLLHGLAVVSTFVLPAIYLNHRASSRVIATRYKACTPC